MAWLDDLVFGLFGNQPTVDATAPALGILGFIFWVVVLLGGGFGGFFVLRWLWLKYSYEGAIEIAPFRIHWMGKYGNVEGNLSINESFDEEVMVQLERHSTMKFVADMIRNEIRNGNLFIYNFKLTDEGQIVDSFSRRIRIISPIDMTLPKYTWMDSLGKRNFGSILRREKRRNIVVYHTSQKITIVDEDGNEEDWWIICPVPMVESKELFRYNGSGIPDTPVHYIEIKKIEGAKALAEMGSFAPTLAESIQKFLQVRNERDNYAQMYTDKVQELEDSNMEKNQLKHLLTQKVYVGREEDAIPPKSRMNFGWLVMMAFATLFFNVILPEFVVGVDILVTQMLGTGIAVLLIGFAWKYSEEKNKSIEEKIAEKK